jgi:hypothetical protein
MRITLSILLFAIGSSTTVAIAQTAAERAACMADFQKYCTGVEPGGGRIIECLSKQLDKLTPECKKVVEAHAPK